MADVDASRERVEVIKGEPKVIGVDRFERRHLEQPVEEVHHVDLPPRQIVRTKIKTVPNTQSIDRFAFRGPADVEYVDQQKVVKQIIEVPKEYEEIIAVDVPEYKIEETPIYVPYVASTRVVRVEDPNRQITLEDRCWVPRVEYNALEDPQWEQQNYPGFVSGNIYEDRFGNIPSRLKEVDSRTTRKLLARHLNRNGTAGRDQGGNSSGPSVGSRPVDIFAPRSRPVDPRGRVEPTEFSRARPRSVVPSSPVPGVTQGMPVEVSPSLGFVRGADGRNELAWAV